MPGRRAVVDYGKCCPDQCKDGVCTAALVCPKKQLTQEAPFEPPMPGPSPCKGCEDCVLACPLKAIQMTSA